MSRGVRVLAPAGVGVIAGLLGSHLRPATPEPSLARLVALVSARGLGNGVLSCALARALAGALGCVPGCVPGCIPGCVPGCVLGWLGSGLGGRLGLSSLRYRRP